MTHLALNTTISQRLRARYQVAIGFLPLGLMFASFAPLWLFASWLAATLGMPDDAPVRDHPNGWTWGAIFLIAMVVFMLSGYALGWLLNAFFARSLLGWSTEKVDAVYGRSEVPSHWLKDGDPNLRSASSTESDGWEEQRKVGAYRFILTRGVAAWGAPMFLAMYVVPTVFQARPITLGNVLFNIVLWAGAGAAFGASIWYLSEYNHRKRRGRGAA